MAKADRAGRAAEIGSTYQTDHGRDSMRIRIVALIASITLLVVVVLGCSARQGGLSRVTPTPTKTQRALLTATLTATASPLPSDTPAPTEPPVPPTATPLPSDTPLPPSDTPIPPTEVIPPTDTPLPPTDTAAPPTAAPTSRPKPTNTPVPPTATPKPPQVDFKVKEIVAFEDGSLTSTGLHNVYFTVVDAGGTPIDGVVIEEVNNQPATQLITGDKGPGKAEFLMWGTDYRFKVAGNTNGDSFSSETTHVLSVLFGHAVWDDLIRGGICADEASCRALGQIHYSYNVTFQRTH
jgi:hypothetical protein